MAPGWTKAGTEFDAKYRAEVESIPNTEPLHVGGVDDVPGTFDVITMIHVLEHIVDPVDVLKTLRGKLTRDGLLLIEVPHHPANPFELLIADHRTHFTATSLTRVLAAAGYEIISIAEEWIPKELSVVARPATNGPAAREANNASEGLPDPGAAAAARERISDSLAWLRNTADELRDLGASGPVGLFEPFDDAVHRVRCLQQLRQLQRADARQHALKQTLFVAPNAVLAQGQRQWPALGHGIFDAL